MAIDESPDAYLADFGVAVVCGAASGLGNLDMPDQVIGGGFAISTEYSVLVKTSVFAAVAVFGASITVGGISYKVKEFHKVDDGVFARITLDKV